MCSSFHYQREDKKRPLALWKQGEGVITERLKKGRTAEEGGQIRQYEKNKKRLNYVTFAAYFNDNLFAHLWPTQTPSTLFFLAATVSQCVLPHNILPVIT